MDKDAISALEGRELNEAVAETVLGYARIDGSKPGPHYGNSFYNSAFRWQNATGNKVRLLDCSTWESIGLIVESMKAHGWGYYVLNFDGRDGSNEHVAVFSNADGTRNVDAKGETAPLAVARAALLALQEEE